MSNEFFATPDDDSAPNQGAFENQHSVDTPKTTEITATRPNAGPGLIESLAWTVAVLAVHLVASLALMTLLAVANVMNSGGESIDQDHLIESAGSMSVIGFEQLAFVVFAVFAVRYRLGGPLTRRLNLSPLDPLHFVLLISLLIPVSTVSGQCYEAAMGVWTHIVDAAPALSFLDEMNVVEGLGEITQSQSLPLLLLVIAVAPAIGEELIFRGLIGRGLVARYGLVTGVIVSTLLFAAIHVHPAHACAVVPIGFVMHWLYVTTRSFWAPVLFHFANNSMATLATIARADLAEDAPQTLAAQLPPEISACAALFVLLAVVLLWKTRVRHYTTEGVEWTSDLLERPPLEVPARIARHRANPLLSFACVAMFCLFLAVTASHAPELGEQTADQPNAPVLQPELAN